MGLTYADIEVENPAAQRSLRVRALVDSGSVFMTLPEHVAVQLGFSIPSGRTGEVMIAEGRREVVPMVGPVRVRFGNRDCDLSVLVLGDEALFGAVPMEMMDLVLHRGTQTLTVNPANPYVPVAITK